MIRVAAKGGCVPPNGILHLHHPPSVLHCPLSRVGLQRGSQGGDRAAAQSSPGTSAIVPIGVDCSLHLCLGTLFGCEALSIPRCWVDFPVSCFRLLPLSLFAPETNCEQIEEAELNKDGDSEIRSLRLSPFVAEKSLNLDLYSLLCLDYQ